MSFICKSCKEPIARFENTNCTDCWKKTMLFCSEIKCNNPTRYMNSKCTECWKMEQNSKPKLCNICNIVEVKFGSCLKCYKNKLRI
jgi:hypothetical protein